MRISPLIIMVSFIGACTDHGLKIHEDPPTATILEPGDGDGFVAGTPVAFRVQLDDNDDGVDALTVAWRSDTHGTLDGEAELDGSTQTFVTSELELGTHTITVTATDPDGQSSEDNVDIIVRENGAPIVAIESPSSDDEVAEGDDVVVSIRASDPEEDASSLRLRWSVDDTPQIDAPTNPDALGQATLNLSDLSIGTHTVSVEVTDLAGLQSTDTVDFVVLENQPPLVSITTPAEGDVFGEGAEISVWISVTDPEENPETLVLAWTVDGIPQTDAAANPGMDGTAHLLVTGLLEGEHHVSVSASDAFGGSHSAEVNFNVILRDADGDGFDSIVVGGDDCNDEDASIHPDADEICDEIDNDCDELIDADDPELTGGEEGYVDNDADGFGAGSDRVMVCDTGVLAAIGGDCDDDNPAVNPAATEVCNDIDDNCDGIVDELLRVTLYPDLDGDGWGAEGEAFEGCIDMDATTGSGGDCDDDDPEVNPDATEVCNGIDDNCDGIVDEDLLVTVWADEDGDGYGDDTAVYMGCDGEDGSAMEGGDCNDLDPDVNPGEFEICGDGIDNDCDGGAGVCAWIDDTPVSSAEFSVYGDNSNDEIASSMAGGDLTGDGVNDLIIGANNVNITGHRTGAVFIIAGPLIESASNISSTATTVISGTSGGGQTGDDVAVSDVNDDGNDDLLIASPQVNPSGIGSEAGIVSLFYGPIDGDTDTLDADVTFEGTDVGGHLGRGLAGGGDLDGDGLPDIVMAAPKLSEHTATAGAIYVFGGDSSLDASFFSADDRDAKVYSTSPDMQFGDSLTFIGDANGDGRDDLLIGAPGARAHGQKTGAAYLMLGHATNFSSGTAMLHTSMDAWYDGANERDGAGTAIAGLGDVDDDGYSEFAIGAPKNDTEATNGGAVYLMLDPPVAGGAHDLTSTADVRYYGSGTENRIGASLTGNIDLDNDSVLDMIIGGPSVNYEGNPSRGKSFLFYGPISELSGGTLSGEPSDEDGAFVGLGIRDFAGQTVLGGYDWTNDGITDLALAAPGNNGMEGEGNAGAVYVFFGRGM